MAQLNENFQASTVEKMDFAPIPPGEYPMMVTGSEMRKTAKGDDMYVMEYTVIDGQYAGRKVFEYLNLYNQNEMARKIARSSLASLCEAVGVPSINDTAELHDKTFGALLKVETSTRDGKEYASNKVAKYMPLTNAHVAPPAQPQAPQANAGQPSWS